MSLIATSEAYRFCFETCCKSISQKNKDHSKDVDYLMGFIFDRSLLLSVF